MKPTYAELEKRVAELERKVAELQLKPAQHIHHHYQQPVWAPQVPSYPQWAPPFYPTYTAAASTAIDSMYDLVMSAHDERSGI